MKYLNSQEEELKIRVGNDFFAEFDCASIIGKIDFTVKLKTNGQYLLWAEAKAATTDIFIMFTQLVLTIGKARTFNEFLPPPFLGCFDREKIAFIPYHEIQGIFYQNDFNWNVAPSNHETKEFKQVYEKIKETLNGEDTYIFDFETDEKELATFIKENFVAGKTETSKIQIDKNNFVAVYIKWLEKVKPTIMVLNWEKAKKAGIIDGDFYLADLLSSENQTLKEKLFVVLQKTHYEMNKHENEFGFFTSYSVEFSDKQRAHSQFWAKYERPPKEDYWEFMTQRRDLLVPQDVRERKGSYFTPQIWVELSQKYIAKVFGADWQDEYYVWDCAAGTGNLLVGLVNKNKIWASTLDKQDVDVMHDRIENGANLWKEQVFQFDFLNDDFIPKSKGGKLPDELFDIINDEKKRKKLIIYINPPYGECGRADKAGENNKFGIANTNKIHQKYTRELGKASRELFALFLIRIYKEIQRCKIANFAKLKTLNASNFVKFRENFHAKLESLFLIPAYTFDNVDGQFPIGFHIWDTGKKEKFKKIKSDVFDKNAKFIGRKNFFCYDDSKFINKWVDIHETNGEIISYLSCKLNDFQNSNMVYVANLKSVLPIGSKTLNVTPNNLIIACIYFAVRHCIDATWLNDRDQFLYPNNKWKNDKEFQNNCLTYTLFHGQNNISVKDGVNHWIPFSEEEIKAKYKFESHFMLSFIGGKIIENNYSDLFEQGGSKWCEKREFSPEAIAVFDAGRELWKYYHSKKDANPNAAFYDIREYFQGRNAQGRMNSKSEDAQYNELIANLREKMKILAKKIEPKIYEYGFLMR